MGAKYAIPFASNHCFLHRDTVKFNDTGVNPQSAKVAFDRVKKQVSSSASCIVMAPGSSWQNDTGFSIREFDYSNGPDYIETQLELHADTLEKQYEKEARARPNFLAFYQYFTKFCAAVPWFFHFFVKIRFCFVVRYGGETTFWCVDLPNKKVYEDSRPMADSILIETPILVLNDCCKKRMFSTWSASKRLSVTMDKDMISRLNALFALFDFYENDGLPLSKNFTWRQLENRVLRWRELLEYCRFFVLYKVIKRPLVLRNLYK